MLSRIAIVGVLTFATTTAFAADKKALVIETKASGFKELARGLRVTLKQNP